MSGEELKEIRKTLGLNQTELAEKVGIKLRTYQYWEKNERQIPETTAFFVNNLLKNAPNAYNISEVNSNKDKINANKDLLSRVEATILEMESGNNLKVLTELQGLIELKYKIIEVLNELRG